MTALVIGLVALHDDVSSIRNSAADDSVATAALEDGAVTSDKLAGRAVTQAAVAAGAIGPAQIQPRSDRGHPRRARLADRRRHPRAHARRGSGCRTARTAHDSARLGGLPAVTYLTSVADVSATSVTDTRPTKGRSSRAVPRARGSSRVGRRSRARCTAPRSWPTRPTATRPGRRPRGWCARPHRPGSSSCRRSARRAASDRRTHCAANH